MIVVSGSTPIIALARIGQLDLLHLMHGPIVIPQAVFDEVTKTYQDLPDVQEILAADWINVEIVRDHVCRAI